MPNPPRHDLLFSYDFPPMGGGIARWMQALAREYPAAGLRVSTGSHPDANGSDRSLPNPVDRILVPGARLRTIPGLLRWMRHAARIAADPLARFAWCGTLRPAAWPAWWAHRRTGLPYGVMFHGGDLLILREKLQRSAISRATIRRLCDEASVLVANSQWTATACRALLAEFRMRPAGERLQVIALGTDPHRWDPACAQPEAFRTRHRLPRGRWLISVARLVPHKGIDTAIALFASIATEFPDLHYVIVGDGPQLDLLRDSAAKLDLSSRIHFLTGVTDVELPDVLAMSEIYLGLSRETPRDVEGFGISLLEAAAMELPVVAGRSGGIPDAVDDGVTGFLVDPTSPSAASDAVRRLLLDRHSARQMGSAGRQRVIAHFTWSRVVADLQRLAAQHGRPL